MSNLDTPSDSEAISQPVTVQERIISLDVLRGFAVLGILVMNIQSFSMASTAHSNPASCGAMPGEGEVAGTSYAWRSLTYWRWQAPRLPTMKMS